MHGRGAEVSPAQSQSVLPTVPTVDESGVPDDEDTLFDGLLAAAGTSRDILTRSDAAVAQAVKMQQLRSRFLKLGVELTASASPDGFDAYVKAELEKKARFARDARIRIE